MPPVAEAAVLAGHAGNEDAAAYLVADGLAIVQTVDFFTPIVDDAATFGRIAAANAISDVYAMGARPLLALALVAWPRALGSELLGEIVLAGAGKAAEAGIPVLGGHSIDDPEPKYGLAVTGLVAPDALWRNSGGRAGDELYMTKPLGTGVIATAIKAGEAPDEVVREAVASMERLNRDAADAVRLAGPNAVTDVTGFGLAGHCHELAAASGLRARLELAALPWLAGVRGLAEAGHVSGGTRRNLADASAWTTFGDGLGELDRLLVCDAQTSGGLLVSLPAPRGERLRAECALRDVPVVRVGRLEPGPAGALLVE
jgi:selenide,water dikinase